jgi:hypothetical protein
MDSLNAFEQGVHVYVHGAGSLGEVALIGEIHVECGEQVRAPVLVVFAGSWWMTGRRATASSSSPPSC